jgi:hypothetical protein
MQLENNPTVDCGTRGCSRGDWIDRGRRAWSWLDARLDQFTPWRGNDLSMEGLQALSEIAIAFVRLTESPMRFWNLACSDVGAE